MNSPSACPKWWQMYLVILLMIVLFMLDIRLKLSLRIHQIIQLGILMFIYWLVHLWLNANAAALSNMNERRFDGIVIITRTPLHSLTNTNNDVNIRLQLPRSNIKGVLDGTFEMDTSDVEPFTMDEFANELNKESK